MADHNDLSVALARFSRESGRSHNDLAVALTRQQVHPKGKDVTGTMIYNYATGITRIPGWIIEGLDTLYPGWQTYTSGKAFNDALAGIPSAAFKDGRPTHSVITSEWAAMPTLPPLTTIEWVDQLNHLSKSGEWPNEGAVSMFPARLVFNSRQALQRVDHRAERVTNGFLRIGDMVWLDPFVYPVRNTLHAIVLEGGGGAHYAAFIDFEGKSMWQLEDGSLVEPEIVNEKAAIVGIFPQYVYWRISGQINTQGIEIGSQVKWPPENIT